MDDKWNVNVVEFPKNSSESIAKGSRALREGGQMLMSTKSLIILANVVGLTVLAIVGASLGIGLTQNNFKSFNFTCSANSDCKSGFLCQNNLCGCRISQYYDGISCSKFETINIALIRSFDTFFFTSFKNVNLLSMLIKRTMSSRNGMF